MPALRVLKECDVAEIKGWPPYPVDMEQMDYALREKGWLEEFRSRPDAFVYAVEDGGELIGFTILSREDESEAEFRIALRADKTGLGLGESAALQTLRKGFEDHGFSRIRLIVRKNNGRGIRLYQRLGFVDRGECRKEVQGVPVDFRLMEIGREEFVGKSVMSNAGHHDENEIRSSPAPRRALIVIDVQNDYGGGNLPIEYPPVELSLANIGTAMDVAKAAGIPVVVIQNVLPEGAPFMARGTDGAELHVAVATRGWDHHILKYFPSAFAGTNLEVWLRGRGVDTIVIVGYMTHNCDLSTIVQGMHAGFAVEFLSDATG